MGLALVLAVVALMAGVMLAAAALGDVVIERAEAQTAADAVALAAVVGGRDAASVVASRHDAVIESWHRSGDRITVVVRRGDQHATATATDAIEP